MVEMMNAEQQKIIDGIVDSYKLKGYDQIKDMVKNKHIDTDEIVVGGVVYQVELNAFWDDKQARTIRFSGAIYLPKKIQPWWKLWRNIDKAVAYSEFIITPDGTFIEK